MRKRREERLAGPCNSNSKLFVGADPNQLRIIIKNLPASGRQIDPNLRHDSCRTDSDLTAGAGARIGGRTGGPARRDPPGCTGCRVAQGLALRPRPVRGEPVGPSARTRTGRPESAVNRGTFSLPLTGVAAPTVWSISKNTEGDCSKGRPSLSFAMAWFACWIRRRSEYGDIRIGCSRGQQSPAPRAYSWRSDALRESLVARRAPADGLLDLAPRTTTHEIPATFASSWFWCWTERPRRVSIPTAPPGG